MIGGYNGSRLRETQLHDWQKKREMNPEVPYMNSVTKLHSMLDAIQGAAVPDVFNQDFIVDLGFTSSYDRALIKLLKYLEMLDSSGRPQDSYRHFVDHTKSKGVLAARLRAAFDDLFISDKDAHTKTATSLSGWFKTKTGAGTAVAKKIATTFKSLADYADFSSAQVATTDRKPKEQETKKEQLPSAPPPSMEIGLVNRIEIHLPDTQNVDTFRAIFRALREELVP